MSWHPIEIRTVMMMTRILQALSLILLVANTLLAQTNLTDSLVHQSYQRKFMVHLPPGFAPSAQRALVISLHGGSGTMVNAQGFSQLNPVADQNDFIVAWPQGYGIAPPGFSWADGRNTSADQAGIDDVGFLDKLIDTLESRYNVDTTRIYICGFLNGGFMVQRLACQLPDRFAAMASLGSSMDTLLFKSCSPGKPIPFAFFNGTADPAMPYGGGAMQNPQVTPVIPVDTMVQFWVKNNNCLAINPKINFADTFPADNSTAELFGFSNCDCNAEVKFYKLINGGHTWPGVYVAAQAAVLGNTNRDIQASVELWDFFNSHSLCRTTVSRESDFNLPKVSIYPNPTSDYLNIMGIEKMESSINIRNQIGQVVLQGQNTDRISVGHLTKGMYFLQIHSPNLQGTWKIRIE